MREGLRQRPIRLPHIVLRLLAIAAIASSPAMATSPVKTMEAAKKDQLVCRDVKSSGSDHSMRVCRKNQEWAQVDVDKESTLKGTTGHTGHGTTNAHPPKAVK